jgi:hypothetical protein
VHTVPRQTLNNKAGTVGCKRLASANDRRRDPSIASVAEEQIRHHHPPKVLLNTHTFSSAGVYPCCPCFIRIALLPSAFFVIQQHPVCTVQTTTVPSLLHHRAHARRTATATATISPSLSHSSGTLRLPDDHSGIRSDLAINSPDFLVSL